MNLISQSLTSALLATALLAGAAQAQEGLTTVSPELFDSIEEWSSPQASLESVALDEYPDAIETYAGALEDHYRRPLHEALSERYGKAIAVYRELVAQDEIKSSDLVAYLMSHEQSVYDGWQASLNGELVFGAFAERQFPGLIGRTEELARSHAESGQTLTDFLVERSRDEVAEQARRMLTKIPINPGDECACTTLVTSERSPVFWKTSYGVNNTYERDPFYKVPRRLKKINFVDSARGAAKSITAERTTKHRHYPFTWGPDGLSRSTDLLVKLVCWGEGRAGVICPLSTTCSGELAVKVEYGSHVDTEIDLPGLTSPWAKSARSVASDFAQLLFDPPGPAPKKILLEKGVSVAAFSEQGWNPAQVIGGLLDIAQIAQEIDAEEEDSAEAADLDAELLDSAVNNVLGMVYRKGKPGGLSRKMGAEFNTANSIPFHLQADKTYKFDLVTQSIVHTNGWGGYSFTESHISSAYAAMMSASRFQCAPKITRPNPGVYWDYYSAGSLAPYDAATLKHMVDAFTYIELGTNPTGTDQPVGKFP